MIGEWNNGTGRRKSSVARVFLKKGSGKITVNGKSIEDYFGRQTSIMICKQPLVLTENTETFDVMVNVHGGGESGQAGAVRHGMSLSDSARNFFSDSDLLTPMMVAALPNCLSFSAS